MYINPDEKRNICVIDVDVNRDVDVVWKRNYDVDYPFYGLSALQILKFGGHRDRLTLSIVAFEYAFS